MKLILIILTLAMSVYAVRYAEIVKATGPIQYLPMETTADSAYDSSGHGWNGQYASVVTHTSGINTGEYAVTMTGASYVVTNPKTTVGTFNHQKGSVMIWCRSDSTPWGGSGWLGTGVRVVLEIRYNNSNFFQISAKTGVGYIYSACCKGVFKKDTMSFYTGLYSTWVNSVITWDTDSNRIVYYINGKRKSTPFTYSGWDAPTVIRSTVGCNYDGYTFKGKVCHYALWDKELTRQQIDSLSINHKIVTGVAFGNSNTQGALVTYPWSYRLQLLFGNYCLIYNKGISGTVFQNTPAPLFGNAPQVNNGFDRYILQALAYYADYFLFFYGLNDLRCSDTMVNVHYFTSNLRSMVTGLKSAGIDSNKIIICNTPRQRTYLNAAPFHGGSLVKQQIYTDSMKAVCLSEHVRFVNLYDTMLTNGDTAALLLSDGVHLNDSCHSLLAKLFYNTATMAVSPPQIFLFAQPQ